jgi:hypothetical protein
MSGAELNILKSDQGLSADIQAMIAQAREAVASAVNAGITLLYWRIGKRIQTEILENQRAEYGKEIVATLSQQLTALPSQEILKKKLHAVIESARSRFDLESKA